MAVLDRKGFQVIAQDVIAQFKTLTNAYSATRYGEVFRVDEDGFSHKVVADTVAGITGDAGVSHVLAGVCITKPSSNVANDTLTLMTRGKINLPQDVLEPYDVGTPIYIDDNGDFNTVAGTIPFQVGVIIPVWRSGTGLDKIILFDVEAYTMVGTVAEPDAPENGGTD